MVDTENPTPTAAGSPANTGSPPTSAPAAGATAAAPTSNTSAAGSTLVPQWKQLASMNTGRHAAGGLFVNDHQFLVIGGVDVNNNCLSSCEYYDTRTETWTNLSIDMPTPRLDFGVARIDNRVFVMGGIESKEPIPLSHLLSMDLSGGDLSTLGAPNWESLAPMNQARQSFACVSHQQSLYVFGGYGESQYPLDTAERYDTESKQWTPLPPMPRGGCTQCAAGVVGNRIFVVGGKDHNYYNLASTIVFDTSTQQWESSTANSSADDTKDPPYTPTVPDINIPRCGFSVVVVEQFVIAICGKFNETINVLDAQRCKSIEVLDTQRNAWNFSPTPMQQNQDFLVAGFCQDTKEIIVAGGYKSDAAWSIPFETGLLPLGFRLKERGQKVEGDKERGEDQLGTGIIAEVLAEMITFKDLDPPFAVGFLGRWGTGKTFFLNLILDHIIKLQKKRADKVFQEQFAGHIYVVMFSAWTYSKGDIFSSLMFEILKTLNEHLQFEKSVGRDKLFNGDISTLEVFRDFRKGEIEYMKKHDGVLKDYIMKAKKNGDSASEILMEAINVNYEKDKEDIAKIEKKMEAIRIQKQVENTVVYVGKFIADKTLKKILRKVTAVSSSGDNQSIDVTETSVTSNEDNQSIDEDNQKIDYFFKKIKDVKAYNALMKDINETSWWNYKFQGSKIPLYVWMCCAAFLFLALFIIYTQFESIISTSIIAPVMALCTAAMPCIKSVSLAKEEIGPLLKDFTTGMVEDIEVGTLESKELRELEAEMSEIKNRVRAVEGSSLRESIHRIDKEKYESNLGIVHEVHKDLQSISDGMMNNTKKDKIFPRGDPRIILFVDDLDRCDKDTVVDVIEALQLLIKTKLFVAILAIDPRYVTSSLEKHYEGILHQNIPPTGMDFLEKIIQIPFRLPGVQKDYIHDFVATQIQIVEPEEKSTKAADVGSNNTSSDISTNSNDSALQPDKAPDKAPDKPDAKQEPEGEPLPVNRVGFSKDESIMIQETLELFAVGPRCMRRIINVFKLLQVIWKRDRRFKQDPEMKRATLFVMLLAAEESTRHATYTIFEWMGQGNIMYHRVMCDGEGNRLTENNLAKLFKTELSKRDKSLNFSSSGKNEGFLMDYIDAYLTEYTWTDVQGWKDVSSDFLLARSFSFFRLTPENFERIED